MFENLLNKFHAVVSLTVKYFLIIREVTVDYFHPAMPFIYVSSIIISGLLLWFTIYCIAASNYMKNRVIEKYMDMYGVGDVGKYRQLRAWKHVIRRMKTNVSSNWKIAILEADQLMDEILKASGYRASSVDDRFKQIEPQVFSNMDQLHEAHQIRNRVMREADYEIPKNEALKVLRIYQEAFKENGLLD